ncbi:MAG: hypothetical protein R3C18_06950 [Planctomycetaceae bacterium]
MNDGTSCGKACQWIDRLSTGGGTNYLAPFEESSLKDGTHVLFLSDGAHNGSQQELLRYVQEELAGHITIDTVAVECAAGSEAEISLQQMAALTGGSYARIENSETLVQRLAEILVRFSGYRQHTPQERKLDLSAVSGRVLAFGYDGAPQIENAAQKLSGAIHRALLPGEDVLVTSTELTTPGPVTIRLLQSETNQSRLGEIFRGDLPKAKLTVDADRGVVGAGRTISPVAEFTRPDGTPIDPRGNSEIAASFELVDETGKVVADAPGQPLPNRPGLGTTMQLPQKSGPISVRARTTVADQGTNWEQIDELQLVEQKQLVVAPQELTGSFQTGSFDLILDVGAEAGVTLDSVNARLTPAVNDTGLALVGSEDAKGRLTLHLDAARPGKIDQILHVSAQGSAPLFAVPVPIQLNIKASAMGLTIPKLQNVSLGSQLAGSGQHTTTLRFPSADLVPTEYQLELFDLSAKGAIIPLTVSGKSVTASRDVPGSIDLRFEVGQVPAGEYRGKMTISTPALPTHQWVTELILVVAEPVATTPLEFGVVEVGATGTASCQLRNRAASPLSNLKLSQLELSPKEGGPALTDQDIVVEFDADELILAASGSRSEIFKLTVSPLFGGRGEFVGSVSLNRGGTRALEIPVSVTIVDVGEGAPQFTVIPAQLLLAAKPNDIVKFQFRVRATSRLSTEAGLKSEIGLFNSMLNENLSIPCEFRWSGETLRPGQVLDAEGYLIAPKSPGTYETEVRIILGTSHKMQLPLTLTVQ